MLKFEKLANVGDVIKAFDFKPMPDREDSYLIGRVVAKGPIYAKPFPEADREVHICDGYTVYVIDSRSGNAAYDMNRVATEVYVPFEVDFMEWDGRVELEALEAA